MCPHKLDKFREYAIESTITNEQVGILYVQKCRYCGKIEKNQI